MSSPHWAHLAVDGGGVSPLAGGGQSSCLAHESSQLTATGTVLGRTHGGEAREALRVGSDARLACQPQQENTLKGTREHPRTATDDSPALTREPRVRAMQIKTKGLKGSAGCTEHLAGNSRCEYSLRSFAATEDNLGSRSPSCPASRLPTMARISRCECSYQAAAANQASEDGRLARGSRCECSHREFPASS